MIYCDAIARIPISSFATAVATILSHPLAEVPFVVGSGVGKYATHCLCFAVR
ncbi:hypothetical protein [Nostoc sp.]|uniref:hypothetical protein n=1 Tax=Nostoc sp. TaxID=1180 RepID=UPI002FF7C9E3